eukprot:171064_1
MGNTPTVDMHSVDQRELNKSNELSMKESKWCLLVDGFIRSEQGDLNSNWAIELNHLVLNCVVSPLFTCIDHSGHKGEEMIGSGRKYTLNQAKKHALYLENCVGFTFTEKDSIAVFHRDLHSTDLVSGGDATQFGNKLYVFNSFCDDLFIFWNDSMHSGDDLYGSGWAYNLDEAKKFAMLLKECKGFTFDTWRPEKKDKDGIAWFHSRILERDIDTQRQKHKLLPTGSQCLYVKRDCIPGNK